MERIDSLLVKKGLCKSRERAKGLIKAGGVQADGRQVKKPSEEFEEHIEIILTKQDIGFVGRGGLKLEGAIEQFKINLAGRTAADLGASTGGFTQCMLEHGTKKVFAVDVGHGQLDKSLVEDSRVVNLEGINVRNLTADLFGEKIDFVSADLSFISLRLILPVLAEVFEKDCEFVLLIKPQFEVGRKFVGKGGIVKDKKAVKSAVEQIFSDFALLGFEVCGFAESPITGGDGNKEYLVHMFLDENVTEKENLKYLKGFI